MPLPFLIDPGVSESPAWVQQSPCLSALCPWAGSLIPDSTPLRPKKDFTSKRKSNRQELPGEQLRKKHKIRALLDINSHYRTSVGFPGSTVIKNLPAVQEMGEMWV